MFIGFRCATCDLLSVNPIGLCQACGGIRLAAYDLASLRRGGITAETFESRAPALLGRWKELMPFLRDDSWEASSLGETETPLVNAVRLGKALGLPKLQLKLDSVLPTGSLKDRPHSASVAGAIEHGFTTVALSSSGNGAAAISAHAAKAGLKAVVGVFTGVPDQKLSKIVPFNPLILEIEGGMDDSEHVIRHLSDKAGWFNAEAFTCPFNIEGEKTIGLEIAIQCKWKMPDWICLPLGNGAATISPLKAIEELYELGLVDKIPRIAGIQFDACCPIAVAFSSNKSDIEPFSRRQSFSTTLMHEDPVSGSLVLKRLREADGAAISVSDEQVMNAMVALASCAGIFAEPAGAIAVAGAAELRQRGIISETDHTVCLVSGSGQNYNMPFPGSPPKRVTLSASNRQGDVESILGAIHY